MNAITRLRQPMSSPRRTDMEFAINRAIFYSMMIGVTTVNMVLTAYLESLKLSGIRPLEDVKRKATPL